MQVKHGLLKAFAVKKCTKVRFFSRSRHYLALKLFNKRFPQMTLHIHMPVGLEDDTFTLQQHTLLTPTRSQATHLVHDPVARHLLSARSIAQHTTHHPRMTGPSRQQSDVAIRRHAPARDLTDDIQHIMLKRKRLSHRHPIRIILLSHTVISSNKNPRSSVFGLKDNHYLPNNIKKTNKSLI